MMGLALLAAASLVAASSSMQAACPDRPACHGYGRKGGTGYRGSDGRCVGFKDLERSCGPAPHARCKFENAPGTGENRDCALAPRDRRRPLPKQSLRGLWDFARHAGDDWTRIRAANTIHMARSTATPTRKAADRYRIVLVVR